MRPRLLAVLATGVLTLSLLGPVTAVADGREVTGPSLPEQASATARERAEDALARAQALFDDRSPAAAEGRDATLVLNQLLRVRDDLSPADRDQADTLLARPTTRRPYWEQKYAPSAEVLRLCGGAICIQYVETTRDAPPGADGDPATVPPWVEQALATAEGVHNTYVAAGYLPPDPDGRRGGNAKVDIYLIDIGADGLYGYCTSDPGETGRHRPAYCAIDNDFAEFPQHTPEENQQVTLAHEYFHAVQYAYDVFEDPWFMEATATWAEDEVFDDVNDNRQYLPESQLGTPGLPLDMFASYSRAHYGNWIFFRYLTERWTNETGALPNLVREMWRKASARAGAPNLYSTQAIQSALAARNTSFTRVYGQYADAIRRPGRTFSEGAYYPVAPTLKTWRLGADRRRTGGFYVKANHLTSAPLRYRPADGVRARDWRLRLEVDMRALAAAPVARVSVYRTSGKVSKSTIRLSATGRGSTVVPFGSRQVEYVELVLVNASRRTARCDSDQYEPVYACFGRPRDNQRRYDFSASIFRR